MRMSRAALVKRAITVLDDAMVRCNPRAIDADAGLRLALAYLYAVSDDRALPGQHPRHAFDEFLAAVTDPKITDMPAKDSRGRHYTALAALNHIRRRVGG